MISFAKKIFDKSKQYELSFQLYCISFKKKKTQTDKRIRNARDAHYVITNGGVSAGG